MAENLSFSGSGLPRGPRDPLRSTGPAPHINLHKKSAPETNSNAISRGFSRVPEDSSKAHGWHGGPSKGSIGEGERGK